MNSASQAASSALQTMAPGQTRSSRRWTVSLERLRRWEFWPSWAIYLPLVPYILWLGLKHRGLTVCTACNPGIPLGGIVGESKSQILSLLSGECVLPFVLIPSAPVAARLASLVEYMHSSNRSWPIVLKPDAGERGEGVRIIASSFSAEAYFNEHPEPVIAQEYHPGPCEAGVFYIRDPREARGRIFSVTDKLFPSVVGDGRITLADLIHAHPRYRLQAAAHLAAIGKDASTVPARGTLVPLTPLGNHCRGTMFLDGAHLITPELTAAIDDIACRTPGFYFGRFDIRYTDADELRAGRGFKVVELNGLLSESTNIYDPRTSFWDAQRTLREQWHIAFQIGAANRGTGVRASTLTEIWTQLVEARRDSAGPRRSPEHRSVNAATRRQTGDCSLRQRTHCALPPRDHTRVVTPASDVQQGLHQSGRRESNS